MSEEADCEALLFAADPHCHDCRNLVPGAVRLLAELAEQGASAEFFKVSCGAHIALLTEQMATDVCN